jgi:ABC-2 type transport system permease protein
MRLLAVELTRLRWRRAVLVLLAAAVLVPVFILGVTAWDTRPVSAAEVAEAELLAEQEAQQDYVQDQLAQCIEDPEQFLGPGTTVDDPRAVCEEMMLPRAEWFISRQPLDPSQLVLDLGTAVPMILSVLLLLAGATFVGADWNSGSMSNQLLFESRRPRVWAAKAGALALVAAVTGLLVQVGFWLAVTSLARSRDLPLGAMWDDLPGIIGRGTLVVLGAGVVGYSMTMFFRSTVATLGILFAVAVAGTFVIAVLPLGGENERWMLHTNVAAVVQHGADYYNSQREVTCVDDGGGMECTGQSRLSLWGGAGYLGLLLVATTAAGLVTFRRRDVP